MKTLTPTEARKNWFRLLDEVVDGEVVLLERRGCRIVLRCENSAPVGVEAVGPDYRRLLRVPDAEEAERWHWDWQPGRAKPLLPRKSRGS